jgi:hypothetical protein
VQFQEGAEGALTGVTGALSGATTATSQAALFAAMTHMASALLLVSAYVQLRHFSSVSGSVL